MTRAPAYECDPFQKELATAVHFSGVEGGRPFVLLEDTILYPEGGGQPADHGLLGEVEVLDVQKREGQIRHYLASALPEGSYHLRLDWSRRFDHMQQHTGQHLLTAVAQDRFGWETTAFHLGPELCDIELGTPKISPRDLEGLEEAVAEEVRASRRITARRVSPEAYGAEKVRSRGLPEGHEGDIRLVGIEGLDLNTCGGTHLRHTGEIELLKLLGTEAIRGGTRLSFVAGGRVRRRMGTHEARNAALRALLGAPDEELAPSVEARLDQVRELERSCRRLEEDLAEALATGLAAGESRLAELHLEGRDAGFLQRLARAYTALAPGKALFLTGGRGASFFFLLAAGEGCSLPVASLGKVAAELLGGRGGGTGRLFQGKAPDLARREEVLGRLLSAWG